MVRRRPSKSGRSRSSRLRVNRDTFHFILGETEDLITKERTRLRHQQTEWQLALTLYKNPQRFRLDIKIETHHPSKTIYPSVSTS